MVDETQATQNPFDPENCLQGGGLWAGKTVTVTRAVTADQPMTYKDGSPVKGEDGTQSHFVGLVLTGIAEDSDRERDEQYSCGGQFTIDGKKVQGILPTDDGRGFRTIDGRPLKFHANSGMIRLTAALKAAGFNLSELYVDGKQRLDLLAGCKFLMRAEEKLGRDGKPLKDNKGFTKQAFYPQKFLGRVGGGTANVAAAGNGLEARAIEAVKAVAGGKTLARVELISALGTHLKGDPQSAAIVGLVLKEEWHAGKPWAYDGKTITVGA